MNINMCQPNLMDMRRVDEEDILSSIELLSMEFKISFGQTQKAINVILKYHLPASGGPPFLPRQGGV